MGALDNPFMCRSSPLCTTTAGRHPTALTAPTRARHATVSAAQYPVLGTRYEVPDTKYHSFPDPRPRSRSRSLEGQADFTSLTSFVSDDFASPNSMLVAGAWNRAFSMPANPAAMPRLSTITLFA